MPNSPFKFLDSYTREDRDIFFGREKEIEELYHRVFESKLLLVYGVSGTGKSSLIHCGLANKFSETDWLPLLVRRGTNILESLASGIKAASLTEQQNKFTSPADFKKAVKSLYLDHYKPVFFIFDQFEELFIFGDKEERMNFIQVVKSLIESDLQCRLIFVMREEYMAWVTEFEKVIPTFFANRVRIEKMLHINAVDAISKPCKVFEISLEDGFAEALLEKLSPGSSEVELTYLQVFLDKIYRLAVTENKPGNGLQELHFSISLLNRVGNVSDLLGSFLDEQIALMDKPETALLVLKSLVSVQGTKRNMNPDEIAENIRTFGTSIEKPVLMEMLQAFIKLRILRESDVTGKVELRHDALATKIFEKFTMAEKELLEVRKYVENAYFTFEKRGLLLNKQDLEYLEAYENKLILPGNLNDFVVQSKSKLDYQKRSIIRITRISTLIFVLIIGIVGRYYIKILEDSKVSDLYGVAMIQSETNPGQGLFTELKIWEKDSNATQLQNIILSDFQKLVLPAVDTSNPIFGLQEYLKPAQFESNILYAEMSKDGNYIYGWMENKEVFVYKLITRKIKYFKVEEDISQVMMSERDSVLAVVFKNNTGEVRDFNGKKYYSFETTGNDIMNKKLVCFFSNGLKQLVVVKNYSAFIYDSTGRVIFELKAHTGKINCVDVSPDGTFVATASGDRLVYIWNFNQKLKQFEVYDTLIGHKDVVWSCRFNKTGKYIITSSKDSTIRIWDLNGRQLNPQFLFGITKWAGNRFKFNNGEYDEDEINPVFSNYYGEYCDASFSPGEREIIATAYKTEDTVNSRMPKYHDVIFYDKSSEFLNTLSRSFIFGGMQKDTIIPMYFSQVTISPNNKVAAAEDVFSSILYLLTGDGRKLICLSGNTPMFSKNGKELFWVSGKVINQLPVHPNEIKSLLDKFGIKELTATTDKSFMEI